MVRSGKTKQQLISQSSSTSYRGKLESAWLVHVDRLEKDLPTSWMQVYKHLMMGRGKELLCNKTVVLHKNALVTDGFHNN